jgi:hypothetical protein
MDPHWFGSLNMIRNRIDIKTWLRIRIEIKKPGSGSGSALKPIRIVNTACYMDFYIYIYTSTGTTKRHVDRTGEVNEIIN